MRFPSSVLMQAGMHSVRADMVHVNAAAEDCPLEHFDRESDSARIGVTQIKCFASHIDHRKIRGQVILP